MTFTRQPSHAGRPAKGQMKCFRCREFCAMKEGDWHHFQNQQVFLCKVCGRSPEEAPKKPRS